MNKTALITGASSGIGYELAHILAREGHDLILTARRIDLLEKLKKEINHDTKVKVEVIQQDLSLPGAPQTIFETVEERGLHVHILINNAGFGQVGPFIETDWEKENTMIRLNIAALVHLTKLFLPGMVKWGSGRIMNVSSTAAFQPGPLMSVYYATKAFVQSFSEALAEEMRGTGITVTALCPGPTISGFQQAAGMEGNILLLKGRMIPSSKKVAEYGYRAMMKGKVVAIQGLVNRLMTLSVRFTPSFIVRRLVKFLQKQR